MNPKKQCPECGAAIPAETPEALCPACLLRRGFETQTAGGAPASDVPLPTPESLASRFPQLEIVELLGRGGMGAVYKARHRNLDRWVALKILPAAAQRDPAFAERFSREAKALARLDHPNIVAVHDSGEADGLYYFIMEYVDGATLRQILVSGGITPAQALAIVPQICEALQYAHDQGIVHRDIKPENILVDKAGRVKIADFGIAKIVGREAADFTLTAMGEVMGTPAYMAPEQVEHPSAVDHRADIYSLGVVFYQMLTGELPLGRFAPPSRKVHIDVRLDEVVLRTLEKEPDLRYQHAGEVKTEVETIAGTPGRKTASRSFDTPQPEPTPWQPTLLTLGFIICTAALGAAFALPSPFDTVVSIISSTGIAIALLKLTGLWPWRSPLFPQSNWTGRNLSGPTQKETNPPKLWLRIALLALAILILAASVSIKLAASHRLLPKPTAVSKAAGKRDLSPVERFQAALQSAVNRRDKDALLALFNLEGVSEEDRKAYAKEMDQILAYPGIKVDQIKTEPLRVERKGKNYTLNGKWFLHVAFYDAAGHGPVFQGGETPKGLKILALVEAGKPEANPAPAEKRALEIHAASGTADPKSKEYPWFGPAKDSDPVYLEPEILLDELNVRSTKVEKDEKGYSVRIILDEAGKQRFAEITARRLEKRIGIVVEGKLVSAPMVKDPIFGGNFTVGFGLTEAEANELAAKLNRAIGMDLPPASSSPPPLPSASPTPAAPASQDNLKNRAAAFVDLLAQGDFAKARAGFDLTMRGAMSEEALGTLWKQLEANGGKFLGHDAPRQEAFGGYQIVYVPCRWERVRLDLKVVYNAAGQISGLWIVSPGDSMLGNPPGKPGK